MQVLSSDGLPPQIATSSSCLVKWEDYDLRIAQLPTLNIKKKVENFVLHGTELSCICETEAGQWKNRKIFIENVLEDTVKQCPKDETLVLISLGSDSLLTEYILGKTLIENGFSLISFFLVDPGYHNLQTQKILKDFRKNIESIFLSKHNQHFSNDRIRFLSRSQNIAKYFPSGANVVVIESLPPYAELIKDMHKFQVAVKSPQDLIMGSHLVQSNQANTVAFVPTQHVDQMKASGAILTHSLPLSILKFHQSHFCLDWGCKIRPDGTYSLSFSGEEYYLKSYGISPDREMELLTGDKLKAEQWIPRIKKTIEAELTQQIESIKRQNNQQQLSQENLTVLLEKVKQVVTRYMPVTCFFSTDYVLDYDAAMLLLSIHAGHHYRKAFSLTADADTSYKITVKEIK